MLLSEGSTPSKDDKNEMLRQIGLAQGMVSFARLESLSQPPQTVAHDYYAQ